MNSRLIRIYRSAFQKLVETKHMVRGLSEDGPTNPMLVSVPMSCRDAQVKVMCFGQETNGWEGDFPHAGGVEHLRGVYDKFVNGGECWRYRGQFWNGMSRFESLVAERCAPKRVAFLYNNVIKLGKSGGKGAPPESVINWQAEWFHIICREITITCPDVVVFFSGPNYDKFITRAFPNAKLQKWARVRCGNWPASRPRDCPNEASVHTTRTISGETASMNTSMK